MHFRLLTTGLLCALSMIGTAVTAAPQHYEGAISMYQKGQNQMVVCSMERPYACTMIRLHAGARIVGASSLARGEFVAVDTVPQGSASVATLVRVFPDRFVRSIQSFKNSQAGQIEQTLRGINGVRSVQVNSELGEAYIIFNNHAVSPSYIERLAARKGIRLSLPGA